MPAVCDIHPAYVQMMLSDTRYDTSDIVNALKALRDLKGHSFSTDRLTQAVSGNDVGADGTWSAEGWLSGRDVLIIGTGPSAEAHREEFARYIVREQPAVLCLNSNTAVSDELVTAFVA